MQARRIVLLNEIGKTSREAAFPGGGSGVFPKSRFRLYSARAIRVSQSELLERSRCTRSTSDAIKPLLRFDAHFSNVLQQICRIVINPVGTRLNQFRFAVSAGKQADSQSS